VIRLALFNFTLQRKAVFSGVELKRLIFVETDCLAGLGNVSMEFQFYQLSVPRFTPCPWLLNHKETQDPVMPMKIGFHLTKM